MVINFKVRVISRDAYKLVWKSILIKKQKKNHYLRTFFVVYIYLLFADNESDWFTTLLVMQLSNAVNEFFHELLYFPKLFFKKFTYHNYWKIKKIFFNIFLNKTC